MEFKLPNIPTAIDLIDNAFRQGSKAARDVRGRKGPRDRLLRIAEEKRLSITGGIIEGELKGIIKHFPSYEQLPVFYQRLLEIKVSKDKYKKSLGAANWALKNTRQLRESTLRKIRKEKDSEPARQYLGRVSSIIKQIGGDLDTLIEIKKQILSFPGLKEDQPTLVIAGYPNVGKSTFLRNLTGSKVQIAPYPFTTTEIQVGRFKIRHTTHQILDIPGLLERPQSKRNKAEHQALLALKELADNILFLIDPTQELASQYSLLKDLKSSFKAPFFIGINKVDEVGQEVVLEARKVLGANDIFELSAIDKNQCEEIFKKMCDS